MGKTIKIIKRGEEIDNTINANIVFKEIQRDTIGKSSANPTWGEVYEDEDGKKIYKGIGLYKEYDYDIPQAACSEKVWSILGKNILTDIRVPNIDVVEEQKGDYGAISYRLLDNDTEDLIHIRDILFHKFEREDLKKKRDMFQIGDILECINKQVNNPENYKKIEKNVIQTLLLDSITNNGDRHSNNWALIRNKKTNKYELAVYDHASSFVDMFKEKKHFTVRGWVGSYIVTDERQRRCGIGASGEELIRYISANYREHFEDFCIQFDANLDKSIDEISKLGLPIDIVRLKNKLNERRRFLKSLTKTEKGEVEYGE